jgi:molecular chaperone GrpE
MPDENTPEKQSPEAPIEDSVGADATEQDLKAQLSQARSEFLYLRAEFDNYKKNVIRERSELVKYGSERLLVSLLGVLDILDQALATRVTPENLDSFAKGIQLTRSEFAAALDKFGVKEMECLGQPFNPNHHQALSSEPSKHYPPGTVSTVFKKPYKLHDRLIRPAQVIVAQDPASDRNDPS